MSQTMERTTVYTLTIETKNNAVSRVFRTEEAAQDALVAWARQWWPQEVGRWPDQAQGMTQEQFDALPDDEAISVYFEVANQFMEFYSLDSATLEG